VIVSSILQSQGNKGYLIRGGTRKMLDMTSLLWYALAVRFCMKYVHDYAFIALDPLDPSAPLESQRSFQVGLAKRRRLTGLACFDAM
jgi:hypothetical protein